MMMTCAHLSALTVFSAGVLLHLHVTAVGISKHSFLRHPPVFRGLRHRHHLFRHVVLEVGETAPGLVPLGPVGSLCSFSCLTLLQVRQCEDKGVDGVLWRSLHWPGGPERFWRAAAAWSAIRHDGGVLSFHDIRWVV